MAPKFQTVDEYIASFPEELQAILEYLRRTVKKAAPEAEEKISYQMPTYTLAGRPLVYFAGWKRHIGIYGVAKPPQLNDKLTRYAAERGSLRFPVDEPIPWPLITDIVKFSAKENLEKAKKKRK